MLKFNLQDQVKANMIIEQNFEYQFSSDSFFDEEGDEIQYSAFLVKDD